MRPQLYVFTAGNKEARKHLEDSIKKPISLDKIINFFKDEEKEKLKRIDHENGLYAWGAVPGPKNTRLWEELRHGDYVLCVYDNTYHYVAKVLQKFRNEKCAREIWGSDPNGQTWELMYFLTKPEKINVAVRELDRYLNKSYMGFTRISDNKLRNIEQQFGSLEKFLDKMLRKKSESNHSGKKPSLYPKERFLMSDTDIELIIAYIESKGFIYEPWQIAQFITAVRTKPFVILAGISGTGKSKLPALVAEATGGKCKLIPVRPDWTDSSDILGYVDLQGNFRPGAFLEVAHNAMNDEEKFWTCIIDEMNLARVEHYFAEILSKIEDRQGNVREGYKSAPLLEQSLSETDSDWNKVVLPSNLCIVGTVNMDESSHGFSRKVLDRAFTIELSEVHLDLWKQDPQSTSINPQAKLEWPIQKWYPRAIQLAELNNLNKEEENELDRAIEALKNINQILITAQLQVGYRVRDEIVLYLIHANEIRESFKGRDGQKVDPLDLAFQMKILPRILGGSSAIRSVVLGLLGWAVTGETFKEDEDARNILEQWESEGRPMAISEAPYPRLAARLCLMWERLLTEGYTSYWL